MARSTSRLAGPLARAARRFETWRSSRTTQRIPAELWSLATDLGARFGVSRTARALRVQYYALKKRVDATATMEAEEARTPPAFVEILTAPSRATSECLVEFESANGTKMRIQVNGAGTLDLAELSRLFLEQLA